MSTRLTRHSFTRNALAVGAVLAHAAVSRTFVLIAALYWACDLGRVVEIAYVKPGGQASVRVIEPADVFASQAGDILVAAHDLLRGESRSFRLDRITAYRLAA